MNYAFPIITDDKEDWPKASKCPVCGKPGIFEPNSFACLSGGALLLDTTGRCDWDIGGFLGVAWHGAHSKEGGRGRDPDIYAYVDVATGDHTLQYQLYFCSTDCLRAFLNSWVDALEQEVQHEKGTT